MRLKGLALLLLSCAAVAQTPVRYLRIDFGSPYAVVNGVDPVFGPYGQIQTTYQGISGNFGFYDPRSGMQIVDFLNANVTGISDKSQAGIYTSPTGFDIQSFQFWPRSNQFFSFQFGATATIIVGQLRDGTVEGWYDDFHFNDTSFIATPVFASDGTVSHYNSETYTVPGATSTQILATNRHGRAGSFKAADGTQSGFVDRRNGKVDIYTLPNAAVNITALGADCFAGYVVRTSSEQAFVSCGERRFIPVNIGVSGTRVMEILPTGQLAGYAQDNSGRTFGFITLK
jgi:hypothetical protein